MNDPDAGIAARPGTPDFDEARAAARRYPPKPVTGVGGVILIDGKVLLVRRRFEPMAGRWSLPGGTLELGETLQEGAAREMKEETGLEVKVGPVLDVFDRITRDADGRVLYHYVLVDFLCRAVGGVPKAASDASEIALVDPVDLDRYNLSEETVDVINKALVVRRNKRAI